jgi:DNA replication protein DnaC
MLTEPTMEKLRELRLEVMAATFLEQQRDLETARLSFEERLGLMVDAEWIHQQNKRLQRRLREAKLKLSQACVEDIDYPARRELDRAVIRQLSTCRWIEEYENLAITGATGVGKTYITCALAHQACRKGYRAIYRRVPRLFQEFNLARADGTYVRLLAKFARIHVLVLEDFGLTPLSDQDRYDLLEILEDRYGRRSTIVTSQLPPDRWHDHLADPTVADAILDRLIHNAHRIELKGPSRRKRTAKRD